jgi:hypothetical protein
MSMTIHEDRVRKTHEINSLSTLGDVWGSKKIGFWESGTTQPNFE